MKQERKTLNILERKSLSQSMISTKERTSCNSIEIVSQLDNFEEETECRATGTRWKRKEMPITIRNLKGNNMTIEGRKAEWTKNKFLGECYPDSPKKEMFFILWRR